MNVQRHAPHARPSLVAGLLVAGGLALSAVPARSQTFIQSLSLNEPTQSGQYLSVADKTGLQGNSDYTIEAWVRPISYSGFPTIVGNNFVSSFWVGLDGSGRVRFYPRGTLFAQGVGIVPLNQWTHVAVTYSSALGWAIYLNGVLDAAGISITGAPGTSPDSLGIGADLSAGVRSFFWRGGLDEIRIWRTALSEARIQESMRCGAGMRNHTGPRYAAVEAYWGMTTFILESATVISATDETYDVTGGSVGPNRARFNGDYTAMLRREAGLTYYHQAILMNGIDDHVSIQRHASYGAGVTIEAWIYPLSTASFPTIAGRDFLTSFWFGLTPAGTLRFYPRGGAGFDGIKAVAVNEWTHVAATYDPLTGTATTYINGNVDRVYTGISGPIGENGRDVFAGADNLASGTSYFFPGMMDEVCITDGVLAASAIRHRRFTGSDPSIFHGTPNDVEDLYGAVRFTHRAHMGMYAYRSSATSPLILVNGSHARLVPSGAPMFYSFPGPPVESFLLGPPGGQGFTMPDELTLGTLTTTISVSPGIVHDVDVFLSLACDDLTKLICTLRSPSGTTVSLIDAGQLSQGRSLQTVLDDDVPATVSSLWVPYEPTVQPPGEPLSTFDGELAYGNWDLLLSISDESHMAVWAVGLRVAAATVGVDGNGTPEEVVLANAGVEPVRGQGAVRFTLPEAAHIDLGLYDPSGRRVRSLQRGMRDAGEHHVTWSSSGLQAGRYYLTLEVEGGTRRTLPVTVLR